MTGPGNLSCDQAASWTEPTATDNCTLANNLTWTKSHAPGSTFPIGSTTVTYVAKDEAGNNSLTCSFVVTVKDNTIPEISDCPTDFVVMTGPGNLSCDQAASWTEPTATDNCTLTNNLMWTKSHTPGATFPIGPTTVTYVAKDEAGNNSLTCSFVVTVEDNTVPEIVNCPDNVSVSTGSESTTCDAFVEWTEPTATDNCSTTFTWNQSHLSGAQFSVGTTLVIYQVKDEANNASAFCSFMVTVIDATPPSITCPSDVTVQTGEENPNCSQIATWDPAIVSDNCGSTMLDADHTSGDVFNVGSTPVIYSVTDGAGNISNCSFNVIVQDNTPPVIQDCPVDFTVYTGTGNTTCTEPASWMEPTASDNCGIASLSSNIASGSTFNSGNTLVTYTAIDLTGNQVTCSFIVTVDDQTPPSITCPVIDPVIANNDGSCTATNVDLGVPTTSDNCSAVTLMPTFGGLPVTASTAFPQGINAVTWTATDEAGNESSCTQAVTVDPLVATMDIPDDQFFCPGESADPDDFVSSTVGVDYSWTNNNTSIGLAAGGNGQLPGFTASNPSNTTPEVATITVTPSTSCPGSEGIAVQFTITIQPTPTAAVSAASPICALEDAQFTITGTEGAEVFYSVNSGTTQSVMLTGGTAMVTVAGVTVDQTIVLSSISDPATTCTASLSGTETVVVNPLPTQAEAGNNQTVCPSTTADLAANTPVVGTGIWTIISGPGLSPWGICQILQTRLPHSLRPRV